MNVPVPLRLALIAVGATAFYTWVGQMVPQKEVQPPQVVEIAKDVTTAQMVEIGKGIFEGKGLCQTCHKIGGSGPQRFPDLAGIAARAGTRIPGMSALAYLAHSLYEPDAFIVSGFSPGMPAINKPPVGLTDDEIKAVIAYLQTLGGAATIDMSTQLVDAAGKFVVDGAGGGDAAPPAAQAAAGAVAPAEGAAPGAALLASLGCTACHYVDRAGELKGPSLYDVGSRLDRQRIVVGIVAHRPSEGDLSAVERATVADVQAMADFLLGQKGRG